MMLKLLPMLCLLALSSCAVLSKDKDHDQILAEVFGKMPEPTPYAAKNKESDIRHRRQANESNADAQDQASGILPDDVLDMIFGRTTSKPEPDKNAPETKRNRRQAPKTDEKCTNTKGEEGVCVPYYLCSNTKEIVDESAGVIDIHFGADECESSVDICCQSKNLMHTGAEPAKEPAQKIVA